MPSYSQKASPWQNACIESFHALIKREWLYCSKVKDFNHAYRLVFEYIETFYNTVRSHSHCGYLSPEEYEEYYYAQLENSLAKAGYGNLS
jgi:transposase InsO family protein